MPVSLELVFVPFSDVTSLRGVMLLTLISLELLYALASVLPGSSVFFRTGSTSGDVTSDCVERGREGEVGPS